MNKPEPLRPKKRPASAIILALAVIALVSVVSLTMSSLSQLNERTSVVRKESVLARKNALLGLKVAVGQIQENLGVDQAITLNARHYNRHDADATNDTKDYAQAWTAALPSTSTFKWESPNEDPVWLVSGNGIASTPSIKPDTDLESLPHAELGVTYTNRVESIPVKAPLRNVSIHATSGKPTGRYAYWVDDEGMKARVNYFDIGMHADRNDGNANLFLELTSTPKTGIEILNIPSPTDTEVPTLNDGTNRHDYQKGLIGNILKGSDDEENGDEIHPFASFFFPWSDIMGEGHSAYDKRWPLDLNKLHSAKAFEAWLGVENLYKLHETLTFNSYGVFSDTKDGGLKRDLGSVLGPDRTLPTELGEDDRIFQVGGTITDKNPGGPKWAQLAHANYTSSDDNRQASYRLQSSYFPWTDREHGYGLGRWLTGFILRVKVDAWEDGDPDAPDAEGKIFQNYKYKLVIEYQAYGARKFVNEAQPYLNLSGPWDSASNSYHHMDGSHDLTLEPLIKTKSKRHNFFNPSDPNDPNRVGHSSINLFGNWLRPQPKDRDGFLIADAKGLSIPWSREIVDDHMNEKYPENRFESSERSFRAQEHSSDPWRIDFKETNADKESTFTLRAWENKAAFDSEDPPTLIVEGLSRKAYPYLIGNDDARPKNHTAALREIGPDSADFESELAPEVFRESKTAGFFLNLLDNSHGLLPFPDERKILYSYYWGLPKFWTARLGQPQLGTPTPYTSRWNAYGPYILADPETGRNLIYQGGVFSRSALRQWVGSLPPVGNHPTSLAVADEAEDTTASPNLDRRLAAYDPHWLLEGLRHRGKNESLDLFYRMKFPWSDKLNYPSKADNNETSVYDRMGILYGWIPRGPNPLGNDAELFMRKGFASYSKLIYRGNSFYGINIAFQFDWIQLRPGRISRYPHESIASSPIGNSWLPAWFGLDSSDTTRASAIKLSEVEYTEPASINGHDRGFTHYDWCYKLNEVLWDRYFFSERASESHFAHGDSDAPSNRFTFLNDEEASYEQAAANSLNTWALNVNTPHEDGWKNLMGARWNHLQAISQERPSWVDFSMANAKWIKDDIYFADHDLSRGPVLDSLSDKAEDLAESGYFNADDNYTIGLQHWDSVYQFAKVYSPVDSDLRREEYQKPEVRVEILLNLRHVNSIASTLTEQVAVRGPYKSLGQFINRDKDATGPGIENRRRQIEGVLQYAIDESGANDFLLAAEDGVALPGLATFTGALNGANMNALDAYWKAGYKLDHFNPTDPADQTHNTTYRTYYIFHGKKMPYKAGIEAYVSQSDLLASIGHIISPRSDTFTIHFYGESTNPITGEAVATAQGRAIVQRLPEFIDTSDDAWAWNRTNNIGDAPNAVNLSFGRRFVITSIRWE